MHLLHPDLMRQQRVEGAPQVVRLRRLPFTTREPNGLAECMTPGIRSAGAGCDRPLAHQPLQDRFELGLDRPIRRLALPPREATPVVLNHR